MMHAPGLCALRCVVGRIKAKEVARRGYSEAEMKGMDTYDVEDDRS